MIDERGRRLKDPNSLRRADLIHAVEDLEHAHPDGHRKQPRERYGPLGARVDLQVMNACKYE